jgi:hypothetical protein
MYFFHCRNTWIELPATVGNIGSPEKIWGSALLAANLGQEIMVGSPLTSTCKEKREMKYKGKRRNISRCEVSGHK